MDRNALIASEPVNEDRIAGYIEKLDRLYEKFASELKITGEEIKTARAIFDWLWSKKPSRYQRHGPFKLHQVIDAQMSASAQTVGNCLGLTLLYHCLLRRSGIRAEAIYIENAFDIGPHVLSSLTFDDCTIDVENILPDGFGFQGHLRNPSRIRWGDRELVADIYLCLGNECFEKDDLGGALRNYEKALALNPDYEKAHLNKIIAMGKLTDTGS
ncbi:MAG: tetratricopeptide repeat protein [Deltaproteobacteria bacterium]|nr:tetratricopeptide repeat protein [Deltaproteobacteria bacterium]